MTHIPKTILIKPSNAHHTSIAAQTLNSLTARADYFLRGTQTSKQITLSPKPQMIKQHSAICFEHNSSYLTINANDDTQLVLFCDKSALVRIQKDNRDIYLPMPLRLSSKPPKNLGFELGEKLLVGHIGWRKRGATPTLCLASQHWPNGDGTAVNLMAKTWFSRHHINGDVDALKTLLLSEIEQLGKAIVKTAPVFFEDHPQANTPCWMNLRNFNPEDFETLKNFAHAWRQRHAPEWCVKVTSALKGPKGLIFPLAGVYNENLTTAPSATNKRFQSDLERVSRELDLRVLAQRWVIDKHLSPSSRMRPAEQFNITPQDENPYTKHQQMKAQACL